VDSFLIAFDLDNEDKKWGGDGCVDMLKYKWVFPSIWLAHFLRNYQ